MLPPAAAWLLGCEWLGSTVLGAGAGRAGLLFQASRVSFSLPFSRPDSELPVPVAWAPLGDKPYSVQVHQLG